MSGGLSLLGIGFSESERDMRLRLRLGLGLRSESGQFTLVYGCWKPLQILPLFAIFSGVVQSGPCRGNTLRTRPGEHTNPKRKRGFRLVSLSFRASSPAVSPAIEPCLFSRNAAIALSGAAAL